jgi:hypothetical protein
MSLHRPDINDLRIAIRGGILNQVKRHFQVCRYQLTLLGCFVR